MARRTVHVLPEYQDAYRDALAGLTGNSGYEKLMAHSDFVQRQLETGRQRFPAAFRPYELRKPPDTIGLPYTAWELDVGPRHTKGSRRRNYRLAYFEVTGDGLFLAGLWEKIDEKAERNVREIHDFAKRECERLLGRQVYAGKQEAGRARRGSSNRRK